MMVKNHKTSKQYTRSSLITTSYSLGADFA
jgi:hypothetical protein